MKAELLIVTIAYPDAWEVLFHVELWNVLHTPADHGIDFVYHTRPAECRHNTICFVIFPIRNVVVIKRFARRLHESYSACWIGDAIASGLLLFFNVLDVGNPSYWTLSCQFLLK